LRFENETVDLFDQDRTRFLEIFQEFMQDPRVSDETKIIAGWTTARTLLALLAEAVVPNEQ
jgi:hypothetical protein